MEIAEEEEEEQRASKRQSIVREEDQLAAPGASSAPPPHSPFTLSSNLGGSLALSGSASTANPPTFAGVRPPSPAFSLDAARHAPSPRPADLHSQSVYTSGKPKVKLGPRPSLDISGRPRTSAGPSTYRPISTIPAGFKLFSKGTKKGKEPDAAMVSKPDGLQISEEPASFSFLTAPAPISEHSPANGAITRPHTSGGRPMTSSGVSVKSAHPSIASVAKISSLTPEKARLKKAMQLREKRKKTTLSPAEADMLPRDNVELRPSLVAPSVLASTTTVIGTSVSTSLQPDNAESRSSISNADSGIDVDISMTADHASVHSETDSHPTSPLALSSEVGDSTKASSLSESTDETIHAHSYIRDEAPKEGAAGEQRSSSCLVGAGTGILVEEGPSTEGDIVMGNDPTHDLDSRQPAQDDKEVAPSPGEQATHDDSKDLPVAVPLSRFASPTKGDTEPQAWDTPATPRLRIPTSKFSTQDPMSTQSHPSSTLDSSKVHVEVPAPTCTAAAFDVEADAQSVDTQRSRRRAMVEPIVTYLDVPGVPGDKEASKSETSLSDDEELMEEIQTATVHEAKPITVSKSPITPVFPNLAAATRHDGNVGSSTPLLIRAVSTPIRGPLLVPGDVASSARTVSSGAAFLHKITQQTSSASLPPKKANMGSSISQRIKALEKLSAGTAGGAPDSQTRSERPSAAFFSVRKPSASVREPSRSPSVAERAQSLSRNQTPSPPDSRESSPEAAKFGLRDRSGSMAGRLSVFEGGSTPRGRAESVQVTARIVRDPGLPFPTVLDRHSDASDQPPLGLMQSPLVVDHRKADIVEDQAPAPASLPPTEPAADATRRKETIQERRMSREQRRSQSQDRAVADDVEEAAGLRPRRRSSLSIVKDFIKDRRGSLLGTRSPSTDNLNLTSPAGFATPAKSPSRPPSVHTTTGLARRLSISSRRSSMSRDRDISTPPPLPTPLSPALMTEASGSSDETKSSPGDAGAKKGPGGKSRATRFMRRLSSSLGAARKTPTPTISPTVAEEDEVSVSMPPSRGSLAPHPPAIVSYLGDVNVQFPDNLLWKRRTMCLDSQGFLILSTVQGVTATTPAAAAAGREKQVGAIKRYHLSDFRVPYTPEMEVQELPNSVCLDFVDGSGLQIACEDRAGQLNVLHGKHSVPCQPDEITLPADVATKKCSRMPTKGMTRLGSDASRRALHLPFAV